MYKKISFKFELANKTMTLRSGLVLVTVLAIVRNICENDWKSGKNADGSNTEWEIAEPIHCILR